MKPIVKNILIIGGLFAVGSAFVGYEKVQKIKAIFEKMTIKPYSLPKNVVATLTRIAFDIDIILRNPTGEDFAASGYVATLKEINVYFRGKYIGNAKVNISEVIVPSRDTLILPNIRVEVATTAILDNVMTIVDQLQDTGGLNSSDIEMTGTVEVLGNLYEIG